MVDDDYSKLAIRLMAQSPDILNWSVWYALKEQWHLESQFSVQTMVQLASDVLDCTACLGICLDCPSELGGPRASTLELEMATVPDSVLMAIEINGKNGYEIALSFARIPPTLLRLGYLCCCSITDCVLSSIDTILTHLVRNTYDAETVNRARTTLATALEGNVFS